MAPVNRLTNHGSQLRLVTSEISKPIRIIQKDGIMHPIAFSIITGLVLIGFILSIYVNNKGKKNDSDFNIYS